MSYKRSFTKTIEVHYSGTAHRTITVGDTTRDVAVHYSGTVREPVTVTVNVDTDPFDASVYDCNNNVGVLTGSVAATEVAQVESIRANSRKVGQTIVDGFFKTVRSDLGQQIQELSSRVDATMIHLRELAARCVSKQKQMEKDYYSLSKRYGSIFNDLNKELENRIYELDRPTFKFKETGDATTSKALSTDMAATVAVAGMENGHLEAVLAASLAKKQAINALDKSNTFLMKQKMTEKLLENCSIRESRSAVYYAPVLYLESSHEGDVIKKNVYTPDFIDKDRHQKLIEDLRTRDIHTDEQSAKLLKDEFTLEVSANYTKHDTHDDRVRDYITKLFNNTLQK